MHNNSYTILFTVILAMNICAITHAQNYYPINIGNKWVLESEDKAELITHTVEKTEETINNIPLILLKITNETVGTDDVTTQELFVNIDDEGIKVFKFVIELESAFGVSTALLYPPELYYPTSPKLGDSWEITAESELKLIGPFTFISTNTVNAIEDVETPAGTFKNCLKIKLRTKTITALGTTRSTSYQWLAPNFGPVKFENSQDIVYKLVSSNLIPNISAYDVTGDGVINILDLVYVASRFGKKTDEGDVNNDGEVNILDLTLIAKHFGKETNEASD